MNLKRLENIKIRLILPTALLLLFVIPLHSFAQKSEVNKKVLKWYHQAQDAYKKKEGEKALVLLSRATKKDTSFIEGWLLKAEIYSSEGNNQKAIAAYRHALDINPDFFPPAGYFMGNLLLSSGKYSQAADAFREFLTNNNISPALKAKATKQLVWAKAGKKLMENPVFVTIKKANSLINTTEDEYVNYLSSNNQKLVFTRKVKLPNTETSRDIYREQFYESVKQDSNWQQPVTLNLPWAQNKNVGAMSLTADGKDIYFTGCRWPGSIGRCDLYNSHLKNGTWQIPVNLGKSVNSPAWESQPFVSADGKYLLFASTRPGGYGGSDIWMSVKLKSNQWSAPVNLGDSINTSGNEMAPFLYADNKTLVFSSDGHPGLGKQDLFIARKNSAGIWQKAENIGYPVNTKYNEINLIYSLNGKYAAISSDREQHNFDIYEIPVYPKIKPERILFFHGKVIDKKTGKPVSAQVILTDVTTGLKLSIRHSAPDDGTFLMIMEPRQTYAFNILSKGYLMLSDKYSVENLISDSLHITKTFRLTPIKQGGRFTLKNLYFETDSPELKGKSFFELNKLITYLNLNPSLKLEIRGHTDNSGSTKHNLSLSRQRAKAVYDYLTAHNIKAERLSYSGYGASQPVADNSTSEGKAKNRRVELIVK